MKTYARLFQHVRPHWNVLILSILFMLISSIFDSFSLTAIVPLADKVLGKGKIIIDRELPGWAEAAVARMNATEPLVLLNMIIVFVIVMFVLKGVFAFLRTFVVTQLSFLVVRDLRDELYAKIQHLSLAYFSQSVTGDLVSTITYDVEILRGAISFGMTNLIYQMGNMIFLTMIVVYINWKWALITVMLVPLVALPIHQIGRVVKKISSQAQAKMGELNQKVIETITGVRVVKAFGMEETEIKRVAVKNNDFYRIMMRLQKRLLLMGPFVEFIGMLGAVFILYYGGREVIKDRMSVGVFMLFLGALLALMKPCRRISEIHGTNQQAISAAERIFKVMDEPVFVQRSADARDIPALAREIHFENVHFQYDHNPVLCGVDLRVRKGQVVALVGSSGAGKTTLVSLLPRFYDPTQGRVCFDGVDIRQATFSSLRRQIGVVTQDLFLFNDTVRNNIAYGFPDATLQMVESAARLAEAHEFICRMPQGYDTVIGDMGTKLSGGQKQRLSIARAMINNPPIVILDEATSQLDAESTRLVQDALDRVFVNRTVFVIAHRLTTIKKVDRIIALEAGKIVEEGSHDQLLQHDGVYKRLFELEFMS